MSNRREWQPRLPTRRSGTTLDLLHGRREGPNQIKEPQNRHRAKMAHPRLGQAHAELSSLRGGSMPNEAPRMTSWALLGGGASFRVDYTRPLRRV
jgi:hypothetical protein